MHVRTNVHLQDHTIGVHLEGADAEGLVHRVGVLESGDVLHGGRCYRPARSTIFERPALRKALSTYIAASAVASSSSEVDPSSPTSATPAETKRRAPGTD